MVIFELPVESKAELHAPGSIALNGSAAAEHTPIGCVVSVEARIVGLHVIQHVRKIKVQGAAESLGECDSLADAEIQVPQRQTSDREAANLSIQAKNGVADRIAEYAAALWAACIGVGQYVLTGPVGATGSAERVLMADCAVVQVVPHDHVLERAHVSGVALAERPAVAVRRADLDREATSVNE